MARYGNRRRSTRFPLILGLALVLAAVAVVGYLVVVLYNDGSISIGVIGSIGMDGPDAQSPEVETPTPPSTDAADAPSEIEASPSPVPIPIVLSDAADVPTVALPEVERIPYSGEIEHLFFHPAIAFPELAFDGDQYSEGFQNWFVTVPEIKRILESLYGRGYVLINYDDFTEVNAEGDVVRKPLLLPKGKKPVILSIDNVNYYTYMRGNGAVDKLIVDEHGDVATYTVLSSGQTVVSRDNEIIPILDEFVRTHPDFSLDGAKGYIGLTGYEGVLGYRTDKDSPVSASEIAQVQPVIDALRADGWRFACNSYAHFGAGSQTYESLAQDTARWFDEVKPLVGDVDVYLYPFGEYIPPEQQEKYDMLHDYGIRILVGVGPDPYFRFDGRTLTTQRRRVDGLQLRTQQAMNAKFYDADAVYDREGRDPFGLLPPESETPQSEGDEAVDDE